MCCKGRPQRLYGLYSHSEGERRGGSAPFRSREHHSKIYVFRLAISDARRDCFTEHRLSALVFVGKAAVRASRIAGHRGHLGGIRCDLSRWRMVLVAPGRRHMMSSHAVYDQHFSDAASLHVARMTDEARDTCGRPFNRAAAEFHAAMLWGRALMFRVVDALRFFCKFYFRVIAKCQRCAQVI